MTILKLIGILAESAIEPATCSEVSHTTDWANDRLNLGERMVLGHEDYSQNSRKFRTRSACALCASCRCSIVFADALSLLQKSTCMTKLIVHSTILLWPLVKYLFREMNISFSLWQHKKQQKTKESDFHPFLMYKKYVWNCVSMNVLMKLLLASAWRFLDLSLTSIKQRLLPVIGAYLQLQ